MFPIRNYDSYKLATPPRLEGPDEDDEPNDEDATPLIVEGDDGDNSGGGPVGETQEIPVSEIREAFEAATREAK